MAEGAPAELIGLFLRPADAFGEDAHPAGLALAALAQGIADDVVVEHRRHGPAARLGGLGEQGRAPQPLFLGGEDRIDDRRVEALPGQDTRGLEHQRDARRVVVGARRV